MYMHILIRFLWCKILHVMTGFCDYVVNFRIPYQGISYEDELSATSSVKIL